MATSRTQTITVKSNEENPEPLEVLAQAIIDVAEGIEKINKSRLSRRAIVLLLKDSTGLSMREIELVLDAAPKLKTAYLKSVKP